MVARLGPCSAHLTPFGIRPWNYVRLSHNHHIRFTESRQGREPANAFNPVTAEIMRTILLVGLVALLLPGCTPLKTVNKSADAKVFKVFVTNEKNNGRPLYNVRIPGGTEFELMHAEEIGSSLSSGVWHYNEDLRLTVPDRAGTSNDITIVTTSLKKAGRPLFNVKLPDGTIILSMYAEEIALSLHTGIWQFSKNVRIE